MGGTAGWRTDLYVSCESGTLVTHAESIALLKQYGRKATPELKNYTQGEGMPSYDEIRAKVVREGRSEVTDNDMMVALQALGFKGFADVLRGFMAQHYDRYYCGKTGHTYFYNKEKESS